MDGICSFFSSDYPFRLLGNAVDWNTPIYFFFVELLHLLIRSSARGDYPMRHSALEHVHVQ